jgi:hypothetical protein
MTELIGIAGISSVRVEKQHGVSIAAFASRCTANRGQATTIRLNTSGARGVETGWNVPPGEAAGYRHPLHEGQVIAPRLAG